MHFKSPPGIGRLFPAHAVLWAVSLVCAGASPWRCESGFEWVAASDVRILAAQAGVGPQAGFSGYGATVAMEEMRVDYLPHSGVDTVGVPVNRSETRLSGGVEGSHPVEAGVLTFGVDLREGYSNFRALWIDEYYRQQFGRFDAYTEARPRAWGGTVGFSRPPAWNRYARMDVSYAYSRERISAPYERVIGPAGGLIRGDDRINTNQVRAGIEVPAGNRFRWRNDVYAIHVTDRAWRYAWEGRLNWNPAGEWVVRNRFFYARESNLWAYGLQFGLEYTAAQWWTIGIAGRYYSDNGQTEEALAVVSMAAPPLRTRQVLVTLRFEGSKWAFQAGAGPYRTRYARPDAPIAPFLHLYRDRNWIRSNLAVQRKF